MDFLINKKKENKYIAQQSLSLFHDSNFWLFIFSIVAVALSLYNHEPWLDEAEAPNRLYLVQWDLWRLIQSFRGDGHFPLYHTLLFPFFNIGRSLNLDAFSVVKFFTFIQYVFFAILVCRWIRFPYGGFLLFSYYALYEYGSISRCYLLALIFLFIILRSLVVERVNPFLKAIAYFCFPLTHVLSMILALPIFGYLILQKKWGRVGILTTSFACCYYFLSIRDTQDPFVQFPYLLSEDTRSISDYFHSFLNFFLSAWFPFSSANRWWNQSFVTDAVVWIIPLLIVLVILAIARAYLEKPLLVTALVLGSSAGLAILIAKYPNGSFRHIGYTAWPIICFLCLSLFGRNLSERKELNTAPGLSKDTRSHRIFLKATNYAAIVLLTMNVFAGLAAVYKDSVRVFDGSVLHLQAINEIQASETLPIFAQPCWSFWPIAALSNWHYINSPLWYPDGQVCDGGPGINAIELPQKFLLYTWTEFYETLNKPNPLPELGNRSIGRFLRRKERVCEQVYASGAKQTRSSYLYYCQVAPEELG